MTDVRQYWVFTFGCGQKYAGKYVKIFGTFSEARAKMCEKYGKEWSFQYSEKEWNMFSQDPVFKKYAETELEVLGGTDRTIYISGAITGTTDYAKRFCNAEKHLREEGWNNIINPVVVTSEYPEGTTWEQYMRECIRLLVGADVIYMLCGWNNSKGAAIEHKLAKDLGIEILYEKQ